MIQTFSLILIVLLLSGCGVTLTIVRNEEGKIEKIKSSRAGRFSYKGDGEEAEIDTKMESPFKGLVSIGPKI